MSTWNCFHFQMWKRTQVPRLREARTSTQRVWRQPRWSTAMTTKVVGPFITEAPSACTVNWT